MFWAEIVAAPIVVPVVFFLWKYTSITISADQSTITVELGIAFILGFAIRRTIGLLDVIKKKIMPDPELGSAAAKAAASQGVAPTVPVPDLKGKTQADAKTALENAGLVLGKVDSTIGDPASVGRVVSQTPIASSLAVSNTPVAITLGVAGIKVPSLIDQTKDAATDTLTKAGLALGDTSYADAEDDKADKVVKQNPEVDRVVLPKTAVSITLGKKRA